VEKRGVKMKTCLIERKTKGKEQIFIMELNGKKMLKDWVNINYPRNKLTAFLIKEVVLVRK